MSLKESAQIRYYKDKEGVERVQDVILNNVRFNYTFLINARPATDKDKEPSFETNLIITDDETAQTFLKAFSAVYEDAVSRTWRSKSPALDKMNVPFYVPEKNDDGTWGDFEEDAIVVLKAKNRKRPELFMQMGGRPDPVPATDDDVDEFYSGMIGKAVVSFWAYDADGARKPGIMLFLNGVSKTGEGEQLWFGPGDHDLLGAFSEAGGNVAAFAETKPSLGNLLGKKTVPEATEEAPAATTPAPAKSPVASLLKPKKNILQPDDTVEPIDAPVEDSPKNTLQTLIKRGLTK